MELQPGQVNWGVYNPNLYPVPSVCGCITSLQVVGNSCNYRFRQPLKGSEQYHYGMIMTDGVTLSPGGEEYVRITQEMKNCVPPTIRKIVCPVNWYPGVLVYFSI